MGSLRTIPHCISVLLPLCYTVMTFTIILMIVDNCLWSRVNRVRPKTIQCSCTPPESSIGPWGTTKRGFEGFVDRIAVPEPFVRRTKQIRDETRGGMVLEPKYESCSLPIALSVPQPCIRARERV